MIPFDAAELEGLVDLLRDCPGRISAVVVPGQETGTALLERLVKALPELTFEVMEESATPGEIGRRAQELGSSQGNVLVLRLDRRLRPESEDHEEGFWRRLNYQRERLASGDVRSCLFMDGVGNDRLALLADDLYEWVMFFRFPAPASPSGPRMSESPLQMSDRLVDGTPADLDVLRDQWRRAREAGLPEQELVWDYTRPLFAALVRSPRIDEASRLWKNELRDGDALEALPDEQRLGLLLDACMLARYEDRERFISRAREYVATAEKVLTRERSRDSGHASTSIARSLFSIGYMQSDLGEREAAQKSFHEALEIYRRLAAQHPAAFEPNVAATLNSLGNVQRDLGEREAARECYAEALGIYAPLAEKYPRAFAHNLEIVLRGYTSVTPESEDDPWWRLWRELTRQPEDAPT
jgi:tetratricopeptide (TPR) repeat protein